jgi:hypothetical protein
MTGNYAVEAILITKQILAALVLVATIPLAAAAQAPKRATLGDGTIVLLYADGTWKQDAATTDRKAGSGGYTKPGSATESVSVLKNGSLSYDPAKWRQNKSEQPGRQTLTHVSGDGYAMVISERLQLTRDALKGIVLNNARQAAPDAKIVFEESRVVNGGEITCLEIVGSTQGIEFHYFGYYYAGKAGTVQVLTYTGENLFDEYKADFEELLNGFEPPRS